MPQSTIFVPGARLALLPFVSLCLQHAAGYGVPGHATVVSRQEAAVTAYDFVIAGGGIGGLTMANRLSEDPNGKRDHPSDASPPLICSSSSLPVLGPRRD